MAKLDNTSGTVIAITFLVMNLATWWRRVFCVFLCLFGKRTPVFGLNIIPNYKLGDSLHKKLIFNQAFRYLIAPVLSLRLIIQQTLTRHTLSLPILHQNNSL